MDSSTTTLLVDAVIAIGLGLMVGLEREHKEASEAAGVAARGDDDASPKEAGAPPVEALAGVRTFALLSLAGWASVAVGGGGVWLPAVTLAGVAALFAVAVARERGASGLTTEAAGLVMVLTGMLVTKDRALALALAVATTMLLLSKSWFREQVPRLRRVDLTSTVQVVVAFAVLLPLLPVAPVDPWGALPPRKLGLFVGLILGVSWVGYVLARVLGERKSTALTGVVGGLASSTALTAAMAERGRDEHLRAGAQLATCLACAVMSGRLIVITAVVSPSLALRITPAVGAMGVIMLAGAAWKWLALRQAGDARRQGAEVKLQNPMSLLSALKWGVFLTVVLLAAHLGKKYLGEGGLYAAGAIAGLADVDAITLAMSRDVSRHTLDAGIAALVVTIAAAMNTVVKAGIAWMSGGRAHGADIAKVFAGALAVGLAVAVIGAA